MSFFIVERLPRNVLLAAGLVAVSIPLAGEAAMTAKFVGTSNKSGLAAGDAFLYIYIWFYALFLDGPGYFYVRQDLYPPEKRECQLTCGRQMSSFRLIYVLRAQPVVSLLTA